MPVTTYRLQLHQGFPFAAAREVVPYLAQLGVTDCYCSPIFTATPGSTHGYDVCRHTEINPELGGDAAFVEFSAALQQSRLGCILDFVPNHMSNDPHTNDWWRDVLENGPSSPFARYFDIDWHSIKPELKDRLLLPILGEPYGEALERGALALSLHAGAMVLSYGTLTIPTNPRRSAMVFETAIGPLERELGAGSAELREFLSILAALRNLPPYVERDARKIAERHREKQVARERLDRLIGSCAPIQTHLAGALAAYNGTPGDPRSFDRLHALLELQAYRLASWRTAADEINYRRFFDINELAGLRVEDPEVFDGIHGLLLELLASGRASGVRLDHIDGLFDPRAYLQRLAAATPSSLVVEKILSDGEALRPDWPVAGTTGYTFLNDINGVFIDPRRARKMQRVYARLTGHREPFADVAYESKRLIVATALSSEFQVLAQSVNRLSESDRRSRDFTLASIRRALREVVACFPVYRTYVSRAGATAEDAAVVDAAIVDARNRNPAMESSIFDFLRFVLLPGGDAPAAGGDRAAHFDVAMRFQQYTAPVQAKGVEDTAFYRHHVLASLNEVGGDPGRFGRTVAEFHAANSERQRRWPAEMLATTTHDTKRSEDARARINVLSEMPEAWQAAVMKWRRLNASNRKRLAGNQAPDANDEYLFYQALLGAWPAERPGQPLPDRAPLDLVTRLSDYMAKAIKEAKVHTSWITPNRAYESAVAQFVERTLSGRTAPAFLAAFLPFAQPIFAAGMINALAQLTLKLTSPGVPDFYQGTELWDLSLVDPDNRRPVNFDHRRHLLRELEPLLAAVGIAGTAAGDSAAAAAITTMLDEWPDGRIKMFLTALGMRLRRSQPLLFQAGSYEPLAAEGPGAGHLVAFARQHADRTLVVIVPRLTTALGGDEGRPPLGHRAWGDTIVRLPAPLENRRFRNLITGAPVTSPATPAHHGLAVGRILDICPVALLWSQ